MRDEELWHADEDRLGQDQRDDRRDEVTGDVGSLGFVGFEEGNDHPRREEETQERDPAIGNDVENFTQKLSKNEDQLKSQTGDKTSSQNTGKNADEPFLDDGRFRDNRETAGQTILKEDHPLPPADQVTPPNHSFTERDGADVQNGRSPRRNEPDRS